MRLALAPIPFFWPADAVADFYAMIASTSVDIVYLGETVCYKRRGPTLAEWLAIADRLADHGKEVVLSSLVLVDGRRSSRPPGGCVRTAAISSRPTT